MAKLPHLKNSERQIWIIAEAKTMSPLDWVYSLVVFSLKQGQNYWDNLSSLLTLQFNYNVNISHG